MAWRDRLPLHWQGWLSEAEDGFGIWLARIGNAVERAGVRISDHANERWDCIQPQIAKAVEEAGICPCGRRHADDG